MKNVRAKITTAAIVVGLGGLGGVAMATNPANDAQAPTGQQGAAVNQSASAPAGGSPRLSKPVVTRTSGGAAPTPTPAVAQSQAVQTVPAVARTAPNTKPVVTHTSGGGSGRHHHHHEHEGEHGDGAERA